MSYCSDAKDPMMKKKVEKTDVTDKYTVYLAIPNMNKLTIE